MTLISPDNDFALMAALFVIAGGAFLAEKTRIGSHLTGAVIDLRHMLFETTRMTIAFLVASVGTIIGVIIAVGLLDLSALATAADIDPELREAGIAGLFTSTYIGGSVNYAALGEITGLRTDASFFSAATATDNLFSAVFLSVLALLPGWSWLARRFTSHEHGEEMVEKQTSERISSTSLTLALAAAISFVAIGDAITGAIGMPSLRYAIITLLVLIAATAFPHWMQRLHGAFELGVGLAFVFFAAIVVGRLFRLTIPELVTASNAAVLGATTAPALAAARGWHDLVTPGVLVGVLGYALGTFAGTAVFHLWGLF
jgi:uncharacterized membrane protein